MLTEKKLKELGFERHEWENEGEHFVDHLLNKGGVTIEITDLKKVEITTKGNYIEFPNLSDDNKLEQLINLLS